jgi:hypothetical protein
MSNAEHVREAARALGIDMGPAPVAAPVAPIIETAPTIAVPVAVTAPVLTAAEAIPAPEKRGVFSRLGEMSRNAKAGLAAGIAVVGAAVSLTGIATAQSGNKERASGSADRAEITLSNVASTYEDANFLPADKGNINNNNDAARYTRSHFNENGPLAGTADRASIAAVHAAIVAPALEGDRATKTTASYEATFDQAMSKMSGDNAEQAADKLSKDADSVLGQTLGFDNDAIAKGEQFTQFDAVEKNGVVTDLSLERGIATKTIGGVTYKVQNSESKLHGFTEVVVDDEGNMYVKGYIPTGGKQKSDENSPSGKKTDKQDSPSGRTASQSSQQGGGETEARQGSGEGNQTSTGRGSTGGSQGGGGKSKKGKSPESQPGPNVGQGKTGDKGPKSGGNEGAKPGPSITPNGGGESAPAPGPNGGGEPAPAPNPTGSGDTPNPVPNPAPNPNGDGGTPNTPPPTGGGDTPPNTPPPAKGAQPVAPPSKYTPSGQTTATVVHPNGNVMGRFTV